MSFDNLMESFARNNDVGELDFRDNKYYIVLDGTVDLACFKNGENCYFHGILDELPEKPSEQENLLISLLKINLSLINSEKACLCIEPDGRHLGLFLIRPLQGLDEVEMEKALVEYINFLEVMKHEIDQVKGGQESFSPMFLMP